MSALTRSDAEDFLYHEAALLDGWQLREWLALLTDDARYEIPSPDLPDDSDAGLTYSLVHDNRALIEERALRLLKPTAHAEYPHSRTRRMIANVRVLSDSAEEAVIASNFAVFRVHGASQMHFTGRYEHILRKTGEGLKIAFRRARLDQGVLDPQGRVSIIL